MRDDLSLIHIFALVVRLAGCLVHQLVQVDARRAAQAAAFAVEALHREGIVLEIEGNHVGVGRHGVDLLLAARAQEREVLGLVELQVVEARDGRGGHDVAPVHEHGVVGPGGSGVEAHDLVEQLQPRARVVRLGMQAARGGLARLEAAQRLGRGHLQHEHLVGAQGAFGNPVARLDERGVCLLYTSLFEGGCWSFAVSSGLPRRPTGNGEGPECFT